MVRKDWRTAAAAAVLAAGLVSGCRKMEESPGGAAASDGSAGDAVAILRGIPAESSGGFHDAANTIARDGKSWERLWEQANREHSPIPRAPAVDFGKEMVALAAMGEKPTPGWSIEIVGARNLDGKFRILYAEHAPDGKKAVPPLPTSPWHAVVLPKSDDPVEWVRYEPPAPKQAPKK